MKDIHADAPTGINLMTMPVLVQMDAIALLQLHSN
jgi:hypothetical protein